MSTRVDPRQDALNRCYPTDNVHVAVVNCENRKYIGHYIATKAEVDALQKPSRRTWSPLSSSDPINTVVKKALPKESTWLQPFTNSDAVEAVKDSYLIVSDKNTQINPETKAIQGLHNTYSYDPKEKRFQMAINPTGEYNDQATERLDAQLMAHKLSCEVAFDNYKTVLDHPEQYTKKEIEHAFTNYTIAYNSFDVELKIREDLIKENSTTHTQFFASCLQAASDCDLIETYLELVPKLNEPVFAHQNLQTKANAETWHLWDHYQILLNYFEGAGSLFPPEVKKVKMIEITQQLNEAFKRTPAIKTTLQSEKPDAIRLFEASQLEYSQYTNQEFVTLLQNSKEGLPTYTQHLLTQQQKEMATVWFTAKNNRRAQLLFELQPYHPRSWVRALIKAGYITADAVVTAWNKCGLGETPIEGVAKNIFKATMPSLSLWPDRASSQSSSTQERLSGLSMLASTSYAAATETAYDQTLCYIKLINETQESTEYKTINQNLTKSKTIQDFTRFATSNMHLSTTITTQQAYLTHIRALNDNFPHAGPVYSSVTAKYNNALKAHLKTFLPAYQQYIKLLSAELDKPTPTITLNDLTFAEEMTTNLIKVMTDHPTTVDQLRPILHNIIRLRLTVAQRDIDTAITAARGTPITAATATATAYDTNLEAIANAIQKAKAMYATAQTTYTNLGITSTNLPNPDDMNPATITPLLTAANNQITASMNAIIATSNDLNVRALATSRIATAKELFSLRSVSTVPVTTAAPTQDPDETIHRVLAIADGTTKAAITASNSDQTNLTLATAAVTAVDTARILCSLTTLPDNPTYNALNPTKNGDETNANRLLLDAQTTAQAALTSQRRRRNVVIAATAATIVLPFVYNAYKMATMVNNDTK